MIVNEWEIEPGADLRCADFSEASLWLADLRGANLREADLQCADLREAKFWGADLRGANLQGASLGGAKLSDETVLPTGQTWPKYLTSLPALLTAGGKPLHEVAFAEITSRAA